jgi:hypothetical protein
MLRTFSREKNDPCFGPLGSFLFGSVNAWRFCSRLSGSVDYTCFSGFSVVCRGGRVVVEGADRARRKVNWRKGRVCSQFTNIV